MPQSAGRIRVKWAEPAAAQAWPRRPRSARKPDTARSMLPFSACVSAPQSQSKSKRRKRKTARLSREQAPCRSVPPRNQSAPAVPIVPRRYFRPPLFSEFALPSVSQARREADSQMSAQGQEEKPAPAFAWWRKSAVPPGSRGRKPVGASGFGFWVLGALSCSLLPVPYLRLVGRKGTSRSGVPAGTASGD